MFNGGPGYATTANLLPFGTGPNTLVAVADATSEPQANPSSWTRFANVLYVDARATGFSYSLDHAGCTGSPEWSALYMADAGDFLTATLDFLDSHPSIIANPVVFVGESYGGARAALLLQLLLFYSEPGRVVHLLPNVDAALPWARARVQAHVDAAFPDLGGAVATTAQMAAQFGHAALMEPSFDFADEDRDRALEIASNPDFAAYLANEHEYDKYDVRSTNEQSDEIDAHVQAAIQSPTLLKTLLGIDPATIQGLPASDRAGAVRNFQNYQQGYAAVAAQAETALRADLGDLGPDDAYWLEQSDPCTFTNDAGTFAAFRDALPSTDVLMTRARFDAVVRTLTFPDVWRKLSMGAVTAEIDDTVPAGAARGLA